MKKISSLTQNELPTPFKSTPLYQQLYVPSLGGPNPSLLNLDKTLKKYSKLSKYLISINLCIGFLISIIICIEIYYISEYYVHLCLIFEHFLVISLIANLIWLISSFMVIFANKKKSFIAIKVYLVLLVFCFIVIAGSFVYWHLNSEKCSFRANIIGILVGNGVEIIGIFLLFWPELYLLKLLKGIHSLREAYLNDNIIDLK